MRSGVQVRNANVLERRDDLISARAASIVCFVAGLWFFLSPWAYYGVSNDPNAWNAWLVGAIIVAFSIARTCGPTHAIGFSYVNAVLGVWIFISPFVIGYTSDIPHVVNSLAVGIFVTTFSIVSVRSIRNLVRGTSL